MNTNIKHQVKPALCILSFCANAIFILFFVLAFSRKSAFISFENTEGALTGACVVSVPEDGADLSFGPVEFSLVSGEKATLQFSAVRGGTQLNIATEPLYDRGIVAVEKSTYGLAITALSPGEAVLQTVSAGGIRDIARVTVVARREP